MHTHMCTYIHTHKQYERPTEIRFRSRKWQVPGVSIALILENFYFSFLGYFSLISSPKIHQSWTAKYPSARFTSVTKNLRLLAVIFTEESASNWAFVSDMNTCNVLENAGGCPDLRHSRLNIWTSAVPLTMQWESANLSFATNIRIGIIFRLATVAVLISSTDNRF